MPDGYVYDAFISYRRRPPVQDWVRNHFFPLLNQWLPETLPVDHSPARVFIDWEIETGAPWPEALEHALRTSRCLIPVWSPEYFRSAWCLAEWQSMLARQRYSGKRVVFPVVFADGEHFPPDAREFQHLDMRTWNTPHLVFSQTAEYVRFDRAIQQMAKKVAAMIAHAPQWQEGFPVFRPEASTRTTVGLPRL